MAAHRRKPWPGSTARPAPLPEVLDGVLDPILTFKNARPAFLLLFARPDLPAELVSPLAAVDQTFTERIGQIIALRNPEAPAADIQLAAGTLVNLFRGVVSTLGTVSVDPAEVKRAMIGCFRERGLS